MCGLFAYHAETITPWAKKKFGLLLDTDTNMDVRPTNSVVSITKEGDQFKPLNLSWGIKPIWAKKLLINAQAETVATKKTFRDAFATHRCLVPCSGWYEWKDEGGPRKQKYYFSHPNDEPLLMAGIWYEHQQGNELVTLTTAANEACAAIHNRMPVLIGDDCLERWFNDENAGDLLQPVASEGYRVEKC